MDPLSTEDLAAGAKAFAAFVQSAQELAVLSAAGFQKP